MDARQRIRYLVRARDVAMTVTGLTMVLTPLALWASPNLTAFYAALLTCGGAYCAYLLLSQFGPHDPAPARKRSNKVALSPHLVDLLQNQRELSRKDLPEVQRFVRDHMRDPDRPERD